MFDLSSSSSNNIKKQSNPPHKTKLHFSHLCTSKHSRRSFQWMLLPNKLIMFQLVTSLERIAISCHSVFNYKKNTIQKKKTKEKLWNFSPLSLPHAMISKCIDMVKATVVLVLSQAMIPFATKGQGKRSEKEKYEKGRRISSNTILNCYKK